jgi:ligand-binding SRPBCC domain-containing protein
MTLKDEFKRRYLIRSMKLIMNSSFIVDKLGSLGEMPPQVQALLDKLKEEKVDKKKPAVELRSGISRSIQINAPIEKVFNFITNPGNWTVYVTSLVDVRNISDKKIKKGTSYEWTYRMLGVNLDGKGNVVEFSRNSKFGMEMEGAFPIRESFVFEEDGGATKLTFSIHYNVPGKVLGVIANRLVIEKLNVKEAIAVLNKVKALCEAENI